MSTTRMYVYMTIYWCFDCSDESNRWFVYSLIHWFMSCTAVMIRRPNRVCTSISIHTFFFSLTCRRLSMIRWFSILINCSFDSSIHLNLVSSLIRWVIDPLIHAFKRLHDWFDIVHWFVEITESLDLIACYVTLFSVFVFYHYCTVYR